MCSARLRDTHCMFAPNSSLCHMTRSPIWRETNLVWIASAVVIFFKQYTDVGSAKNHTIHCCTWRFRMTLPLTHPCWVKSHQTHLWSYTHELLCFGHCSRWCHNSTWQCLICVWMASSESVFVSLIPIKISESQALQMCCTRLQSILKIDILVGVTVFVEVLLHGQQTGPLRLPITFESEFSWVLSSSTESSTPLVKSVPTVPQSSMEMISSAGFGK